eukprot:scaffold5632_cov146-Skeletonema_marinoi.AAC.8
MPVEVYQAKATCGNLEFSTSTLSLSHSLHKKWDANNCLQATVDNRIRIGRYHRNNKSYMEQEQGRVCHVINEYSVIFSSSSIIIIQPNLS